MVYGLGLENQLVAISHECDYPPDALEKPRVSRPRFDPSGLDSGGIDAAVRDAMARFGSVYELDEARLRAVDPDLILTQAVCEVCAVPTSLAQRAAAALDRRPQVVSLDCHTLADILTGVRQVAAAAGAPERGDLLAAALEARLDRVRERVAGRPRPRVLALEWLDPPFVPGHWTPEMIEWAGGASLAGERGGPSRQVAWGHLERLDPDVVVVMPCGYGLDASRRDADRCSDSLRQLAPRAVAAGRAFVVDGSAYFNRSGPRAVDGVEILGALLHPEAFPECDLAGKAEAWHPPHPEHL
jgi:iron complex transport system substrate-binding protein